jgi:small conductance mechanosensitive channel
MLRVGLFCCFSLVVAMLCVPLYTPAQAAPLLNVGWAAESSSSEGASSSAGSGCEGDDCQSRSSQPIAVDVDQVIDVDKVIEGWQAQVNAALEHFGFSSTVAGQWFATAVLVLCTLAVMALFQWCLRRLFGYLKSNKRLRFNRSRLGFYRRLINIVHFLFVFMFASLALLVIWWGGVTKLTISDTLVGWFNSLFSFLVALVFAVAMFELISAALERYFYTLGQRGSSRVNTLVPIARNTLYGIIFVIFSMTVIAELGIDVTPLLAGAGVVGLAIGFGAQALIKDVLNGFIVIVEDLIQVGDVACVGGKTGIIEKITLRKVQLRDLDGRVYTVPFSEIAVVENYTKHFSYYMFNVRVAYHDSPDEVIAIMEEVSAELAEDDDYQHLILEPLEVLGVDAFAESCMIVKARIKTLPIQQWAVGREFNRRMKYAFDKHGIAMPFPHQTLYFGERKDGTAPPARVMVERMTESADVIAADDARQEQHAAVGADTARAAPTNAKRGGKPAAKPQQPSTSDTEGEGGEGR